MPESKVTPDMVDACIGRKSWRLTFPVVLEAMFEERVVSRRRKLMAIMTVRTLIIYNAFLIADYVLAPATFELALFLHLAVVSPAILVVGLAYARTSKWWLRDTLPALNPVLIVGQIMLIFTLNGTANVEHYQYLSIPVMLYSNISQRYGFRQAAISTALVASVYLGVLLSSDIAFQVKFIGTALVVSTGYMSLVANHRMELDLRRDFLKRLKDQLLREGAEEMSMLDALTGLANRRQLEKKADSLWRNAAEARTSVAIVMLDIDRFKPFNDRYGHIAGDNCLKRVAGAIVSELRHENDLAVRYGGEEFMILMPDTDLPAAIRIAERVRRQIERLAIPNEARGERGIVTASFGVAVGPVAMHSFSEILSGADSALYAAKRNGRNQVWPPFIRRDDSDRSLTPLPASTRRNRSA